LALLTQLRPSYALLGMRFEHNAPRQRISKIRYCIPK
jgi:hypothetical protein